MGEVAWLPRDTLVDGGEVVDEAIRSRKFMAQDRIEVKAWKAKEMGWL
jgi:hypothetical protein